MGIPGATFCNWKKKFAGQGVTELRHLRQLEDENQRLKILMADLILDKEMLQEVYRISVCQGCWLLMQNRTLCHWQSRYDDRAITLCIREIAETWKRCDCQRIYCLEGLNLRRKRPAGMSVQHAAIIARP